MRATTWLHSAWRTGCDFLFPPACAVCQRTVINGEPAVCADCRTLLWPEAGPSCQRCAAPVGPYLDSSNGCRFCRKDRFAFETVVRLGVYEAALQQTCLRMKKHNTLSLAIAMTGLLWQHGKTKFRNLNADVVVPVPQHWTRRIWSIHHPAEIISRRLAERLGVPSRNDILWKTRRTPRQFSLTPSQRRSNLRKAFAADLPKRLQGKNVLLVDDVLTTGSTAHEASRALRDAGAGRVAVAVIARGIGR